MIKVDNKYLVKNKYAIITDNYKSILSDEEDILFSGKNKFNNRIIGNLLDIDTENKLLTYLHTIPEEAIYHRFINGKLSYKNYLKIVENIYIVQQDFERRIKNIYEVKIENIPDEFLPLENIFCPNLKKWHTYNYALDLKGKEADENKADPDEVSKIQRNFADIWEDRLKALKGFNLFGKALLVPYTTGSFKINFAFELQQKTPLTDLFILSAKIDEYFNGLLGYIAEDFGNDKELFKDYKIKDSNNLESLKKKFIYLYEVANINVPEDIDYVFREDIWKTINKVEKMTDEIGEHFESISILNVYKNDEKFIAYFDNRISEDLKKNIEEVEISKNGLTEDEIFKDYEIYICHLNTNSRIGNALIKNNVDVKEMSKPKIKINGEHALDQTKYTQSLHLNQWINVKAKAKKIGDRFKYMEIQFEGE